MVPLAGFSSVLKIEKCTYADDIFVDSGYSFSLNATGDTEAAT